MKYSSLEHIFNEFNKLKVLVIGDVMIDSYVWGRVDRISPEAPVPVVHVMKKEKRLGGAANVAKNIVALGANPYLCSVIGDDQEGKYFMELLQQRNISKDGIVMSHTRTTTVKERFIAGSQHLLRVDEEQLDSLSGREKSTLKSRIRNLLREMDVIIFEDYDKGILDRDLIRFTINLANEHGIPTIVDPKKKNFYAYKNATLFKPNLKEIREGMKVDLEKGDLEGLKKAVEILNEKIQARIVLVTLSDLGVYISVNGSDLHIPAHLRSISDVSGAGDTVVSIAALCTALNLDSKLTADLSNLGGGLVCEHPGVVSINKGQLFKEALDSKLFEAGTIS